MDTKELKRIAEAATPGPWRATQNYVIAEETEDRLGFRLPTRNFNGNREDGRKFGAYIAAANPAVVLALIARITELEAAAGAPDLRSAPTDISARLREYAGNPGYSHNDYADTMRTAADECERFYGGMLAWKECAQHKDVQMAEYRTALASAASATEDRAPEYEVDPMDVVRTLVCIADRIAVLPEDKRQYYPSPTSDDSPLMIAARNACIERGFTAGGLAIEAEQGGPA